MPMARRLMILAPLCFLAGLAGGALAFSRRGGEQAEPSSPDISAVSPGHRAVRPQPVSAAERERLLRALTSPGEWSGKTKKDLARLLLADPGFINVIHANCPVESPDWTISRRNGVMKETFATLAEYCPGHLWRVVEKMDFNLPANFQGLEHLMTAVMAAPEDAYATLAAGVHVPENLTMSIFAMSSRDSRLAGPLLQAMKNDPDFWANCVKNEDPFAASASPSRLAIQSLLNAGLEVPEDWRDDPDASRERELLRNEFGSIQAGRSWAAQGFPLERLKGAPDSFLKQVYYLTYFGQVPPPAVYDALIAQGHPEILLSTLPSLASGGRLEELNGLLDGIQSDLSGADWDASYLGFVGNAVDWQPGNTQVLGLIERIQDPEKRQVQTVNFYKLWVDRDPEAVLAHLPQVTDPALREDLQKRAEANLLPER